MYVCGTYICTVYVVACVHNTARTAPGFQEPLIYKIKQGIVLSTKGSPGLWVSVRWEVVRSEPLLCMVRIRPALRSGMGWTTDRVESKSRLKRKYGAYRAWRTVVRFMGMKKPRFRGVGGYLLVGSHQRGGLTFLGRGPRGWGFPLSKYIA